MEKVSYDSSEMAMRVTSLSLSHTLLSNVVQQFVGECGHVWRAEHHE